MMVLNSRRHGAWTWALVIFCLLGLSGCGSTPQLGADKQAHKTADALWTAVCAKRVNMVDDVATRLEKLHAEGKLPEDAFQALATIVKQAKEADWTGAQKQLQKFWSGQRPARSGTA